MAFQVEPVSEKQPAASCYSRAMVGHAPASPGVYLMKNKRGDIIYVGKAVHVRRRLQSYFRRTAMTKDAKLMKLVPQIHEIEVRVCGSELEALFLEAELIRTIQPYFNRMIKHYQSRMYLEIDRRFGKLSLCPLPAEVSENPILGPFLSRSEVENLIETLNVLFKLPTCDWRTFQNHRQTPCLNYEIGRCSGFCAGKILKKEHQQAIDRIISMLNGETDTPFLSALYQEREDAAAALRFEAAAAAQAKIEVLERLLRFGQRFSALKKLFGVLVLPHTTAGRHRLLFIAQGRPWSWLTLTSSLAGRQTLREALALFGAVYGQRCEFIVEPLPKTLYEERRILYQWFYGDKSQDMLFFSLDDHTVTDIYSKIANMNQTSPPTMKFPPGGGRGDFTVGTTSKNSDNQVLI